MSNALVASSISRKYLYFIIIGLLVPAESFACACGCGVFDVGTSSMLPTQQGGMTFVEYDFMNQNKNWHGTSSAPAANNDDKNIKSSFIVTGGEYMFNRAWGIEAQVPYTIRHFVTTDDSGDIVKSNHAAFGDVRVQGIYSGFSPDMSAGITFGLKLPTGDYSYSGFDRDTAIGSGSTDLLLGAYKMGNIAAQFNWFVHAEIDQPFLIQSQYRPGMETDEVLGTYYNGWVVDNVKIAPLAQIINSYRLQDRGLESNTNNSGYERILLSPGVEVDMANLKIYADIEIPVYQQVRGNQLVAPELFKFNISRVF